MKLLLLLFIFSTSSQLLAQKKIQCEEPTLKPEPTNGRQLELSNTPSSQRIQSRLARSGGWSGNGGDFGEVNNNIWFLGKQKINYCIKIADDYFLNINDAEGIVSSSIQKWELFFKKYNLLKPLLTKKNSSKRQHSLEFIDGIGRSANFNFNYSLDCNNTQLQFYFGLENKVISEYKKFETEHPYGFALRKAYDHEKYQNSGIIWVKNLKNKAYIQHTILHELGHIFGMKHDSVYVMRSSMAVEMESNQEFEDSLKIESSAWPYRFHKIAP